MSADLTAFLIHLALVATRLAGFVAVSPFPGEDVPQQPKVGLVVVLAFLVACIIPAPPGLKHDLSLVGATAGEAAIGLLLGAAFRFVLSAAEVTGSVLSHAIGLGTPSILNPTIGQHDTTLGRLATMFALLAALGTGAHRIALGCVVESFRAIPPAKAPALVATVPLFLKLAGVALAEGTRLAMPVLAFSVALQTTMALLARAAPSMQLFSVGFTMMILGGLWSFGEAARATLNGFAAQASTIRDVLERLVAALGS